MLKNILIIFILLLLAFGMGYYSMVINDRLFTRFLFFLVCAGIICLGIIRGIKYILPEEDPDQDNTHSDK